MMEPRMASARRMRARDVLELYELLEREGVKVWIDGGWAVDALLGVQSRTHEDLDIALETRFVGRMRDVLADRGYRPISNDATRPWNFVLGDGPGREIDCHVFTFDENGDGVYGPPENGEYYRADALTGEGVIEGRPVRCISPEWLVRYHTGYELRETDFHDVRALCERFGITLPEEYRSGPPAAHS